MQLDVTVLDKSGQPVRGLTKDDFTLFEDGRPQKIEAFSAVDLPDRASGGPVWESKVVRDVATNEIDNERIVVLLLDDAIGLGLWGKREMKSSATKLVESLGEKDLAAVIFTGANYRLNQNLTLDRARLIKAVNNYPDLDQNLLIGGAKPPMPGGFNMNLRNRTGSLDSYCMAYKEVLNVFIGVIDHLSTLPNRRKALLYFGGALPYAREPQSDNCGTYAMWRSIYAAAQLAHVTINPIYAGGMGTPDYYREVAENTGGWTPNSNDLWAGVRRIMVQNSSYYLLAFQPQNSEPDGLFRRLDLRVNRAGVSVHTRRGYWSPKPVPSDQPIAPSSPQVEALAGVLPLSDLNLRATAAPFASGGGSGAVIALTVGIRQPAFLARTNEQIEVTTKAFTADGAPRSSDDQSIPIVVPAPPANAEHSRYEVLSRVELPGPGKYELRLSAHSAASGRRGSVYVDVDVPDFRRDKLSLSGIIVSNATSEMPTAPLRILRDVSPLVPTSERTFRATDVVTTLVRIYQGGGDKLASVTMKLSVTEASGRVVVTQNDALSVDRFSMDRAVDYQFRLPLTALTSGEYLLTVEATMGTNAVRRDVRFQRR